MNARPAIAAARRGFTLIELLTVIAIIGILAAILIPTVGKVRDNARTSQCVSNMRQAAMSLRLCAEDNRGMLPPAWATPTATASQNIPDFYRPTSGNVNWSNNPVFVRYLPQRSGPGGTTRHEILTCPSNTYKDQAPASTNPVSNTYTYGPAASGLNTTNPITDNNDERVRLLSTIRNPTQGVLLVEVHPNNATWLTPPNSIRKDPFHNSLVTPATGEVTFNTASRLAFFHGGNARANVAFADGSVRGFSPAELSARYPGTAQERWNLASGM
jgi:prepilin-type N-terminal cleavage/methylation domain-containing protein/prepilin-type processing-associated H-X9-DG protein